MKRWLLSLVVVPFMFAVPADAQVGDYGWEDGGTILGSYGNLCCEANQGGTVRTGAAALEVTESPLGGTPQAYVARVCGLTDGDVVTASFWGWDDTPGASPSLRIWGHYDDNCTDLGYAGSADGNLAYTDGLGWGQVSHTWVFDSSLGTRNSLTIEARLYSPTAGPAMTGYIDDVHVEVTAAGAATIVFPTGSTATETGSWGNVKSLFR